jgi:choline dehydrogenase-like flavoprotein
VLDLNCKAHDLDNLYVVDGGFMVTSAAVNPTLTIIANALRVGDHLLERLEAKKAANKVGDSHSARSNAELVMAK